MMMQVVLGGIFVVALMFISTLYFLDKRKRRTAAPELAVSFIVPCHNNDHSVEQTIESIYQVINGSCEVIVVNDKSTDDSPQILERLRQKYDFKLIHNDQNLGKAASLNKVSSLTKHNLLFFVDADIVVDKVSFGDAVARLQQDSVAAVSCPYVPLNRGFWAVMQHMEYNMLSLIQGSYNSFSAISLWGGFIGIKKELFMGAGQFSLNAIVEDMDLAFKLNRQGWRVEQSFYPVKTHVPTTFKQWFDQKIRWTSGTFQCFVNYFRIWIRHPASLFFFFSYFLFVIAAVFSLINNIVFLNGVFHFFTLINETFSLLGSLKATGLLYGAYFIKDLLWLLAFTFFSTPYVLPLIKGIKTLPLVFLVIPFSVIYIPLFSFVFILGAFSFLRQMKKISKGGRVW